MIYKVNYMVKDVEKFKTDGASVPNYVVAENFDSALKTVRKFESDNVSLYELSVHVDDKNIVLARGYVGLAASKTITPTATA